MTEDELRSTSVKALAGELGNRTRALAQLNSRLNAIKLELAAILTDEECDRDAKLRKIGEVLERFPRPYPVN